MKNKKILYGVIVFFIAAFVAAFFVFFGNGPQSPDALVVVKGDNVWDFGKTITEPIKGISDDQTDLILGDLNQNFVKVAIPKGVFDQSQEIILMNPDSVPEYVSSEASPIGAPIEIGIGQPTRLNDKVMVSFKVAQDQLPTEEEKHRLRVVYYDGYSWDYIKPLSVDLNTGIVTFETYHFSLLGTNKMKDDTKITEKWIHSQALDNQLRESVNNKSDYITNQVIDLILEKMGVQDKTIKKAILDDVLKDDGYKEIYDAYQQGDVIGMNQKIVTLASSKISAMVPNSVYKEILDGTLEGTGDAEAVAKAAGYAVEGDYKEAAKIIGENIADKFLITTATKIAVEVVDGQIQSWKNSEVEAAYKAYKNGADGYFWGYNVDVGDFDSVWDQMRGIRRQFELEAIKKENNIREEAGMPVLTEKQEELVREGVKQSYKRQFAERSKNEDALKKQEEQIKLIVDAFTEANFLDSVLGPKGLDKGFDYETKLDVLYHFAQKMMTDTNRFEVAIKEGLIMETKISTFDLVQGARLYFSGPDGKKKYEEYLLERFGVTPWPKIEELVGTWSGGSLTINSIVLPPSVEQAVEESGGEADTLGESLFEGCDFSIDLTQLEGQSVPLNISISMSGGDSGNITISSGENEARTFPFTYAGGVLTSNISEEGSTGKMELTAVKNKNNYTLNGPFVVTFGEGSETGKLTATVSATKPKENN